MVEQDSLSKGLDFELFVFAAEGQQEHITNLSLTFCSTFTHRIQVVSFQLLTGRFGTEL